ncbi:MAG: hypothetical protein LBQ86_02405 [Holophagales bacterium]|jgi:hypothetical protein|nr:hypothetical protein [Holophagales bacterium]
MIRDNLMEEIRERKERISLLLYSQTPEERRQDIEENRRMSEALLGRPIKVVGSNIAVQLFQG